MKHEMNLAPEPFRDIYDGRKTIELRLNDEKRQAVSVGDTIVFRQADNREFWVETEVVALHRFPTFADLYAALPLAKCGYTEQSAASASPDDMLKYYPESRQKKYGAVGIEIKVTRKPFRDVYRFDSFFRELSELWQRVPDWRFGQLIGNFQMWCRENGRDDMYWLEEEDFLRQFRKFLESMRRVGD